MFELRRHLALQLSLSAVQNFSSLLLQASLEGAGNCFELLPDELLEDFQYFVGVWLLCGCLQLA